MGQIIISDLRSKQIYSNLLFNYIVVDVCKYLLWKQYRMVLGKFSTGDILHKWLKSSGGHK
jgi:hypothetical protein